MVRSAHKKGSRGWFCAAQSQFETEAGIFRRNLPVCSTHFATLEIETQISSGTWAKGLLGWCFADQFMADWVNWVN
jgi:hypothetical protein